jgi:hypothetical protein
MEAVERKLFLDSEIYQNPRQAFGEVIEGLNWGDEFREEFKSYLGQIFCSSDPKHETWQDGIKSFLESLLEEGRTEQAGLLFNIHRILTKFRGYDPNDKASSDVEACFGENFDIPEEGSIVVDFFVTRNLPKVVEMLEKRGIDLDRVRVCAPKAILAAQLMGMSPEKREEFRNACGKLKEDQFIIEDVSHNADIDLREDIAVWFSPRTMPITPKLHQASEQATIQMYQYWFADKVSNVVDGGRIYANLAYSEDWKPLEVEVAEGRRTLTKLTGISRNVAVEIAKLLVDEFGFSQIGKDEFSPSDVDPEIDHAKLAKELHLVKSTTH